MMKNEYEVENNRMIVEQIIRRGITEERLISAIRSVPRHLFVLDDYRKFAYSDSPLSIGFGQTISQPYIVALMISELHLNGTEKVLEVGTGCGYQAAILANMAEKIITMELIPELAERASQTLKLLGLMKVQVITGDGSVGWPTGAPYDAIVVSAAAPKVPDPLLEQLGKSGRLILPVGEWGMQQLEIWTRTNTEISRDVSIPVAFVPLRGKHGWTH